ncbi:unnamed protein product [Clonostachys chloroleuca]|uniref:DSC E3 ubiquitin ligase complex subunit A n=1 Tax=Clonostachys chloroleuca TaxID=1926264 RepID=A0AA35VJY9_9HYPO|nr:unnamed protein product [Clonostachys chloroleuca]
MANSQQQSLGVIIFVLFIWMILPDSDYGTQSLILSDLASDRLKGFRGALDVLNQTQWGDFAPATTEPTETDELKYLNLTGFREEDGFAWEDLGLFREKALRLSRYAMSTGTQQLWDIGEGYPAWSNPSGTLHGEWTRKAGSVVRNYDSYNLSHSVPSMDWIHDQVDWARNITGESGRMVLMLEGNKTVTDYEQLPAEQAPLSGGQIRSIKGTVTLEDTSGTGINWEMRLWGAHWPRQGVILMTTTSEKFDGIFGLPHLAPSADFFQSSQLLLNRSVDHTLTKKEQNTFVDQTAPWSSDIDNPLYTKHPSPHCELVLYAQVHPPSPKDLGGDSRDSLNMVEMIEAIESEINFPKGAPVPTAPELQISSVIYSPDCSFFLETQGPPDFPASDFKHLMGLKKEIHLHQVKSWLLIYALVVFAQVILLKSQLAETCTPSTMARVSFGTVSVMVLVDGMTFTAAATWVSSAASTFLPTLAVMFAAFLSMTIGGSFLSKIYEVQLPEGRNRRETSNPVTTTATPIPQAPLTSDSGPILPAPVTAGRPQVASSGPIIVPFDQDIDAEIAEAAAAPLAGTAQQAGQQTRAEAFSTFQAIIGRYVLLSLGISFLAISSTTWYPGVRSAFLNICALLYLSLWMPQIYRNVMRNCRRALRWQFVAGQSVLRVLPIAYFWVKPDNFLYARTEPRAFVFLLGWLWLQIVILIAQDVVGPRFGVPKRWTPEAWDYHPVLREDNLEAGGLPIGLVDDHGGLERRRSSDHKRRGSESNTRSIDCAICRELLEVPVLKAGEEAGSVAGAFARRMYMVTPCRHIFHSDCLEGWLKFRLQCPICREELPPL